MGLAALGIRAGDEVILADTNWIATAAAISYLGAKPVFVDILPETWCINPELAEAAVTARTKAIIAVHLYGNLCEMSDLLAIGERHGIPIVEDAAEAIGSVYHGQRAGSLGRFGTFSFHGTKTVTTGEGGMFVTNDADLYDHVLTLSNHGRSRSQTKQFWADMIGFKYKMSNIQAAIGCAQMERIDELISRKREIFSAYADRLLQYPGITMNPEKPGTVNGYWMPTAVFAPETGVVREDLQTAFATANIDARVFFWPLSTTGLFSDQSVNRVSSDLPSRAINLPSYHEMTGAQQGRVVAVIQDLLTPRSGGPAHV